MRVNAIGFADTVSQIASWVQAGKSSYVVVANVHVTMMAHDNPNYLQVVNGADLVVPDGMPLIWVLRLFGFRNQDRVYGPGLVLAICRWAEYEGIPVFFYGSTSEALNDLRRNLIEKYPNISIAGMYSPPFRPLSQDEVKADANRINSSGAKIVFVGLGAPKQEKWMAAQRNQINAVMIGVGAAFDFLAGRIRSAPTWMQRAGLEWFHRLLMEPRRLWRRYLYYNPRFIALLFCRLAELKKSKG